MVVVYFTLLRPEDSSTLRGIQAPGAEETQVDSTPAHHRGHARRHARPSGGSASSNNASGGAAAGGGNGGTAPAVITPPPAPIVPDTQTPSGDQYQDSASALMKRVGTARSLPEATTSIPD